MLSIVRRLRLLNRRTRFWIVVGTTAVFFGGLCFAPRMPLGPRYHEFADQRTILAIPRCFDVASNALFLVVGVWGMARLIQLRDSVSFLERQGRIPYMVFFAGVALTGIGSTYYHLAPGNSRLLWDLLPMTFCFMSMVAATVVERISVKAGMALLLPLIAFGIASVVFWYLGELQGRGDLRFYLFVQFFSMLAIAVIILLFPARYTRTQDLFAAFIFYVFAKIFELLDQQIYRLTGIVSGHTLKHLTAGLACYWILRMVTLRCAAEDFHLLRDAPRPASVEHAS